VSTESNYPAPPPATEGYASPTSPQGGINPGQAYQAPAAAAPYPGQGYAQQSPYAGQPQYAPARKTNVLAIVSLVSAFFVSLAAVITGHIALKQISQTGEDGRGLAIAGLIIGYVGCAFGFLFFFILFLAAIGSST
jgi:hypothetical protein